MGNKRRIIYFVLMGVCLALFAWVVLKPREPVYQGKTLSVWLEEARQSGEYDYEEMNPAALNAIRKIGTDALPELLSMVATKDTKLRTFLLNVQTHHPAIPLSMREADDIHELAAAGFNALGPGARPALPALIKLLDEEDPEVRYCAAACLGGMGPSGKEAVPTLIAHLTPFTTNKLSEIMGCIALGNIGPDASPATPLLRQFAGTNYFAQAALIKIGADSLSPFIGRLKDTSNPSNWCFAARVVGLCRTNAESAIPLLIAGLNQTDSGMQVSALVALAGIHKRADLCIPAISPFLQSTEANTRGAALIALRSFGSAGKSAVPQIILCLNDPDAFVQKMATNALRAIDPEAAAKAGVK